MAEEATTLPRISVARFKGDAVPGGQPFAWRCNRWGHMTFGVATETAAYRDAADHECAEPGPTLAEQACRIIETYDDTWPGDLGDMLLVARAGQGKWVTPDMAERLKVVAPTLPITVSGPDEAVAPR